MARKIKFALEMADGAKVRGSIEELREHFDLEKAVGYFLSGKLTEWLEDRYYEDEAEALDAIDKDAPDLRARLCEVLGVECEDDAALDVEALARLNEKKAVLRQKTGDESIIANADKTALTQEDLADLLDLDAPVIYLCGESFNIPARVKNKKYIGILGTPAVIVKAKSQEDLDEKGIVFENVKLPWGEAETKADAAQACPQCGAKNAATAKFCNSCGAKMDGTVPTQTSAPAQTVKTWRIPKEQLKAMFASAFKKDFDEYKLNLNTTFSMIDFYNISINGMKLPQAVRNMTDVEKNMALTLLCHGKYTEDDLIHLRVASDMSKGWAFTLDSFCYLCDGASDIIPYAQLDYDSYSHEICGDEGENTVDLRDLDYHAEDGLKTFLLNMKTMFSE